MKILNIILYTAVVVVIIFAALDFNSKAGFSADDKKAVALAAQKMNQQIDDLSFARIRKYNYLNAQINACKNLEGFDELAKKLKLSRAISFNSADNITWLGNKLSNIEGNVDIEESSLENFQTNLSTFAYNISQLDEQLNFAPPVPYKSEVLNKEVSFKDLQNSDVTFWHLTKNMVSAYCLEVEETLLNNMISKVDCGEEIANNIRVKFASDSKTIEPGEDYKADMLLVGEYFTPKIEVTSDDGEITYNNDERKATLMINASVDNDDFDENGKLVKTWKAELKIPSISGYKVFNIEREYTVKQ